MKKPVNPRSKVFQKYQEWLLRQLVNEIWFWSGHARDKRSLGEVVQSVDDSSLR